MGPTVRPPPTLESVRAAETILATGTGCDQRVGGFGLDIKILIGTAVVVRVSRVAGAGFRRFVASVAFAMTADTEQPLLQFAVAQRGGLNPSPG